MNSEIKSLISKTTNRDGLARLFDHIAERLDAMRREMFPKKMKAVEAREGDADDD